MKKVILVHGWDGSPEKDWFPWIIGELKNKGFEVVAPYMPDPEHPHISTWVEYLANVIKEYDKETIFVGHSIGCQTIMRYFEFQNTKAKAAIFVAGWFNLMNMSKYEEEIAKPCIETPINYEKVKNCLSSIKVVLGVNDKWVNLEETKKQFEQKLSAEIITVHNAGHFTTDDGYLEFPYLIEQIDKLESDS